jgi:hypothetical protein
MHEIYDTPIEFIENSIQIGVKLAKREARTIGQLSPYGNDLKKIYFFNQVLCLDVEDAAGHAGVIVLNWNKETFSYSKEGPSRLLSLSALRGLQELMDICGLNYEPKEILL